MHTGAEFRRRRAIRDEDKAARRQDLLASAWGLFQQTPYDQLTAADVATALGLSKGTVFVYFPTKEALFLAVLEQQLQRLCDDLDRELAALNQPASIPAVVRVWSEIVAGRPNLLRLLAICQTILERNVDLERIVAYKRFLLARCSATGQIMERCLPVLAAGSGPDAVVKIYAMIIGAWQLAEQALQRPEFQPFVVPFAPTFTALLTAFLYGLEHLSVTG
jgi:AcrR family transcriptional regulator